jgi:hypothetical protein
MKWINNFRRFQKIKEAFVAPPPPIAHHYNINQDQQVKKSDSDKTIHLWDIKNQDLDTDPPQKLSEEFKKLEKFSGKKITILFDNEENPLLGKITSSQEINDEDGTTKQKIRELIDFSEFGDKFINSVVLKSEVYNESDFNRYFTNETIKIKEGSVFLIERGIETESFKDSVRKDYQSTIYYIDTDGNPQVKKVNPK